MNSVIYTNECLGVITIFKVTIERRSLIIILVFVKIKCNVYIITFHLTTNTCDEFKIKQPPPSRRRLLCFMYGLFPCNAFRKIYNPTKKQIERCQCCTQGDLCAAGSQDSSSPSVGIIYQNPARIPVHPRQSYPYILTPH